MFAIFIIFRIFHYIVTFLINKCKPTNHVFKYEYLKKFIDWDYNDKYDVKREQMHEKIIDGYFLNKTPQVVKRLIFTCGCYGAGKSNVMKYLNKLGKIDLSNYVYADQDNMRQLIPEYEQYLKDDHYSAGFKTNKETGLISELIQRHALFNGYNLIVDSSLRDGLWHKDYIEWIKKTFPEYEIVIIFVKASWERILERNIKRGEVTKRVIPLDCLINAFEQSPLSFELLKSSVDKYYVVDNDYKFYHGNSNSFDSERSKQFENINFI